MESALFYLEEWLQGEDCICEDAEIEQGTCLYCQSVKCIENEVTA